MAIRSGDCGGQKSVSKSRNESPGKMFHSISMEILAVWGVATSLQELYVLHSFIHAFQSQKVLKHVRIALGVYCYCFVFFILKMWRLWRYMLHHTTLLPWQNEDTCISKGFSWYSSESFPIHVSQNMQMGFIRYHLFIMFGFVSCNSKNSTQGTHICTNQCSILDSCASHNKLQQSLKLENWQAC